MAIVGHHPESGVRVTVERPRVGGPPWRYVGEVATESARYGLSVTLEADGAVAVDLQSEPPSGLAEKVRLIVRAAWKHARDDGAPPPLRLARWRAET
jgi:hypothetical protein